MQFYILFTSVFFLPALLADRIELSLISKLFLPGNYTEDGEPVFGLANGALEQIAVDAEEKLIYAVGDRYLHIIDIGNLQEMDVLYKENFDNTEMTDITICGDFVLVTRDNYHFNNLNERVRDVGDLTIFEKFNKTSNNITLRESISVGSLPDMVKASKNCSVIVVAMEGEPYIADGQLEDEAGGVAVIRYDFSSDAFSRKLLNFTSFNSKKSALEAAGVRFSNPMGTVATDLEPEYVDFNEELTAAYICLQENNAIAEVDLETDEITAIHPLGYKEWSGLSLDPSSMDGGIHMDRWPIYGIRMPDAIHYSKSKGIGYILTANEGDGRFYDDVLAPVPVKNGFIDEITGAEIARGGNTMNLPIDMVQALKDPKRLGDMTFSSVDGKNAAGDYETLYTFGGRGFSIVRADTMEVVYDSGSSMEEAISQKYPYLFNAYASALNTTAETWDGRSSLKGPEPEGLETAEVFDKHVVFVGIERPGFVGVYSYTDDILDIKMESLWQNIPDSPKTFQAMYDERILSSVEPEDFKFVPADVSPNKKPILVVAGNVCGSISILEIKNIEEKEPPPPVEKPTSATPTSAGTVPQMNSIMVSLLMLFTILFRS